MMTRRGFYTPEMSDGQKIRDQARNASKWSPVEEVVHLHSYSQACDGQKHVVYRNGEEQEG